MHFLFADNFLTSSLLTLLMPTLLLISIAVWYLYAVKRVPHDKAEARRAEAEPPAPAPGPAYTQQPPQV